MIKLLKNFTFKEWLIVLMCIILTYINVTLELKIPDYMSEITKLIQSSSNTMNHDILIQGMWMTLCAFGSFVCAGISVYFAAKLSSSFINLEDCIRSIFCSNIYCIIMYFNDFFSCFFNI